MRFINVRELRSRPAEVWRKLAEERDLILTLNGRPVGLLSAISEETWEESLVALRRARAEAAVTAMQTDSAKAGRDRMSLEEINGEIAEVRKRRRR